MTVNQKILIVADPLQGIITPSYRLATRLIKMGVDVTFATSFTGVKHIMDKQTTHPSLTFAPFSDGHDTDESNSKQPTPSLQQLKLEYATNGEECREMERFGIVEGKEIKRCVEMVIEDDEMARNAEKWRDLAREALSDGGSSNINLQAFLDDGLKPEALTYVVLQLSFISI